MAMQLGSSGVKSDINVTPFADIVLVLLIIFMVVTPMLSRALDVAVPPKTESKDIPDPTEQLIISVKGPDNPPKVFLNREEIPGGQKQFSSGDVFYLILAKRLFIHESVITLENGRSHHGRLLDRILDGAGWRLAHLQT